ncbi:hypothetical protein CAP35_08860 [Chitinophagaceae bacterium IBVUCB1]|nr:hypothetical protein CAP35_08860 [Chitinophagaceae bacterium IBVUCB1]
MQFKETQQFRQWYIWLILPSTAALLMFDFVYSYKAGSGGKFSYTFAFSVIPILILLLFWLLRLDTTVDANGVQYRFFPFTKTKRLPWSDVETAYVRKYNPLTEYGGWGLRKGLRSKNYAYNVAGNMGLQLVLKNGKRFLLGTQRADELTAVMEELYQSGVVAKGQYDKF